MQSQHEQKEDINILIEEADHHLISGDQINAQKKYETIFSLLSERKKEKSLMAAHILRKLGDSFRDLGDKEEAHKRYLQSRDIFRSRNLDAPYNVLKDIWIIHGNICHMRGDFTSAMQNYKEAYSNFRHEMSHQEIARLYRKIADVYRDLKKYDLSIKYYLEDLFVSENELEMASTYRKLGVIYQTKEDYVEAKRYYEKAFLIKRKYAYENEMSLVNILNCFGGLYCLLNESEKGIALLEKSLKIIKDPKHLGEKTNRYIRDALKWLVRVECQHSNFEKIESLFNEAQTKEEKSQILYHQSLYYKSIKEYIKAREYIDKALSIFKDKEIENQRNEIQALIKKENVLVLIVGLPGTGKTTYCNELKKIPNAVNLEKDEFCKILLTTYFDEEYNRLKPKIYQLLLASIVNNVKSGKIGFPDSYFGDKLTEDLLKDYLISPDFRTVVIYLHCSGKKQLERLKKRNALDRDADKLQDFDRHRVGHISSHLKQLAQIPEEDFLIIDTENEKNLRNNVKEMENFIQVSKGVSKVIPLNNQAFKITVEEAMSAVDGFKSLLAKFKKVSKKVEEKKESQSKNLEVHGVFAKNKEPVFATKIRSNLRP